MPTDVEYRYAWAAGFLDGEGCFFMLQRGSNKLTYCPGITVTQIDRKPLDELAALFGGTVRHQGFTSAGNKKWQWSISKASELVKIIDCILPYLIFKKDQARAVRDLCSLMRRGRGGMAGYSYPPIEAARRRAAVDRFHKAREV